MTMQFTEPSLNNGAEPTELLKALSYEYLAELNRIGVAEFIESVGTDGQPVLIVVIPHVRVEAGRIVAVPEPVGKEETPANTEGEADAIPVSD